jgi:hypothetical protein
MYEIGIINAVFDNTDNSSENIDHFLDSELNCIIHSYSSTISLDFESSLIEDIALHQNVIIQKKDNLPNYFTFFQYKLRGPPKILA